MKRKARIYFCEKVAGELVEDSDGYKFEYSQEYLSLPKAQPISLTMRLQKEPFLSKVMFPFFDGLIPEGWLLDIAMETWKIDRRDRMGLLLVCCRDCIGAVSVEAINE